MPREPETYRLNIERMDKLFPDKEVLSRGDLVSVTGKDIKTVRKLLPFEGRYISKVNLAYLMSKIGIPL